jgi:hypothetical protein
MSEKVSIDLQENSPYRVAFDLASRIAQGEGKSTSGDRKYWLDLYERCRQVVLKGHTAVSALKQSVE